MTEPQTVTTTRDDYIHDGQWHLTWFSHYKTDEGETDEQLHRSFFAFVEEQKRELRMSGDGNEGTGYPRLMGADDTWRWKGPCRCEHCKARGIVRFDH